MNNTVLCKELFILCFDQIWTWKAHNYQWLSNFRIAFIWESNNSKSLGRSVLTPDNLERSNNFHSLLWAIFFKFSWYKKKSQNTLKLLSATESVCIIKNPTKLN